MPEVTLKSGYTIVYDEKDVSLTYQFGNGNIVDIPHPSEIVDFMNKQSYMAQQLKAFNSYYRVPSAKKVKEQKGDLNFTAKALRAAEEEKLMNEDIVKLAAQTAGLQVTEEIAEKAAKALEARRLERLRRKNAKSNL